jgi:hypothetical protein
VAFIFRVAFYFSARFGLGVGAYFAILHGVASGIFVSVHNSAARAFMGLVSGFRSDTNACVPNFSSVAGGKGRSRDNLRVPVTDLVLDGAYVLVGHRRLSFCFYMIRRVLQEKSRSTLEIIGPSV